MHETIDINNLILAVIFSAFGVLVPVLFHMVGLGSIFLPMFIPLAAGAFFLSPVNALILGIFSPSPRFKIGFMRVVFAFNFVFINFF